MDGIAINPRRKCPFACRRSVAHVTRVSRFPATRVMILFKALGDDITVQESDWNCVLIVTPNHKVKPFDDARVRRACRSPSTVHGGSIVPVADRHREDGWRRRLPGSPAVPRRRPCSKRTSCGYGRDIQASRAGSASRLLKEAGQENLKFTLHNRGVDQPYKVVGTWLIDQWKQIGGRGTMGSAVHSVLRHVAEEERLHCLSRLQLSVDREPDCRYFEVPARRSNYARISG